MRWLSWLRRPLTLIGARAPTQQHGVNAAAPEAFTPSPLRARPCSASSASSEDSFVTARSRAAGLLSPEAAEEGENFFSPDSSPPARRRQQQRRRAATATATDAAAAAEASPSASTSTTTTTSSRRQQPPRTAKKGTMSGASEGSVPLARPCSTVVVLSSSSSESEDDDGETESAERGGAGEEGEGEQQQQPRAARRALTFPAADQQQQQQQQEPLSTLPSLAAALPGTTTATTTTGTTTRKKKKSSSSSGTTTTTTTTSALPPPPSLPNLASLVLTPVRGGRTVDGGADPYSLPPSPSASASLLDLNLNERKSSKERRGGRRGGSGGGGESSGGEEDAGSSQILLSSDSEEGGGDDDDDDEESSDESEWRPRKGKENNAEASDDESDDGSDDGSDTSLPLTHTALAAPAPPKSAAAFRRVRAARAAELYAKYNERAFGNRLPRNVSVSWSARLRTTAGLTHFTRLKPKKKSNVSSFSSASSALPPASTSAAAAPAQPDPGLYVEGRGARIELSTKVIDSEGVSFFLFFEPFFFFVRAREQERERERERKNSLFFPAFTPSSTPPNPQPTHQPKTQRLAATLLHEMCHVAAWTLDAQAKPPHGPHFQRWASAAERALPGVPSVRTCHSYRVHAPHAWRCAGKNDARSGGLLDFSGPSGSDSGCGQVYRRHSRSIDVARHACGVCKGKLVYVGKLGADGKPLEAAKGGNGGSGGGALQQQQQQQNNNSGSSPPCDPDKRLCGLRRRALRARQEAGTERDQPRRGDAEDRRRVEGGEGGAAGAGGSSSRGELE